MKLLAHACIAFLVLLAGGCVAPQPPEPIPQPAIDRAETDLFIAERVWPTAERAIPMKGAATITLRVIAKKPLEYVYWREGFGNTVVNSYQDTEFMVLRVPAGATVEWTYVLEGVGAGRETIDGLIRAATGIIGQEAHLRAGVTVYEENS